MSAAKTEPRIQKAARTMTNGPRDFLEKNSEKYENTTGNEPPTLPEGGRGGIVQKQSFASDKCKLLTNSRGTFFILFFVFLFF